MLTSNRSDSRPYTRSVSVTISNRRVRTRTHGGVAGVGGQPRPLCRSSRLVGSDLRAWDRIDPGRITHNQEIIHLAEKRAFCRSTVSRPSRPTQAEVVGLYPTSQPTHFIVG